MARLLLEPPLLICVMVCYMMEKPCVDISHVVHPLIHWVTIIHMFCVHSILDLRMHNRSQAGISVPALIMYYIGCVLLKKL